MSAAVECRVPAIAAVDQESSRPGRRTSQQMDANGVRVLLQTKARDRVKRPRGRLCDIRATVRELLEPHHRKAAFCAHDWKHRPHVSYRRQAGGRVRWVLVPCHSVADYCTACATKGVAARLSQPTIYEHYLLAAHVCCT